MSRRKDDFHLLSELAEILPHLPTWAGPAIAAAVWIGFRFIIPAVLGGDADGGKLGPSTALGAISKTVAGILALAVIAIWIFAEIQKLGKKRLFDTHAGPGGVSRLTWQQFEHFVGEAYRRQGYRVEENGNPAGDGGVDLILSRDNERVLVQCKHWKTRRVGVKPVRELYGVLHDASATRAVLTTSGTFTAEALRFAQGKPIDLIDGPALERMINAVRASSATRPNGSPATSIPPAIPPATPGRPPSAAVPTPSAAAPPPCPVCRSVMVERTARKGPNPGSVFWGCPNYPACRGTREM